MDNTTNNLIAQLRTLLQLTQTEIQVAQTRTAQAATETVRAELAQNAKNAKERSRLLSEALRALGGTPDVVTPAVGRVSALIRVSGEQISEIPEALLSDLALEHQLVDRARYARALAVEAGRDDVVALADRLVDAHTATVEWLTTVLAEEALGGPAALAPTPLQRLAGTAARLAVLPRQATTAGVNRYVQFLQDTTEQVRHHLSAVGERAAKAADDATEVVGAGWGASLERTEEVLERDGRASAAETVHEVRRETGSLRADELPIEGYDTLKTSDAVARVKELGEADEIRAVVAYEAAHKNRKSVLAAGQGALAQVAREVAGVNA